MSVDHTEGIKQEGVLMETHLGDLRSVVHDLTSEESVPSYTRLMEIRAVNRQLMEFIQNLRKNSQSIATSYQRQSH